MRHEPVEHLLGHRLAAGVCVKQKLRIPLHNGPDHLHVQKRFASPKEDRKLRIQLQPRDHKIKNPKRHVLGHKSRAQRLAFVTLK